MSGSGVISKRCGCRQPGSNRLLESGCPRLGERSHGVPGRLWGARRSRTRPAACAGPPVPTGWWRSCPCPARTPTCNTDHHAHCHATPTHAARRSRIARSTWLNRSGAVAGRGDSADGRPVWSLGGNSADRLKRRGNGRSARTQTARLHSRSSRPGRFHLHLRRSDRFAAVRPSHPCPEALPTPARGWTTTRFPSTRTSTTRCPEL